MSANDQSTLLNFINDGKGVYFEGTNIASDHQGTNFWNLFGADYLSTGPDGGDVYSLEGVDNTFAEGLNFGYSPYGEYPNARVNRIEATEATALMDSDNNYTRVVYNETTGGNVIASTIIFGGLYNTDAVSTRANLMATYLAFLTDAQDPVVWTSANAIDFGTLLPNESQTINLYLRNLGRNDLSVSSVSLTGDNFQYQGLNSYNLSFGEIVELPVYFPCDIEGEFTSQLTIESNDPLNPSVVININGSCFSPAQVQLDVESIDMTVIEGSSDTETFTISNIGGGYLDFYIETLATGNRGSGGPDNFGYTWIDSNDPNGPVYDWFDISTIGFLQDLSGIDDYVTVDIPIPFLFYGEQRYETKISTNGYITFGNDPVDHSNDPIPFPMDPNDYIAPLWDDLRTGDGSTLYTYFDEANQRYIIQYQDWKFYTDGGSGDLDFQIQLYPNGDIFYYYDNLEGNLLSTTVGIENQDASDGLQIAYNEEYLQNQLAVKISPNPTWLILDQYSGSVFQDNPLTINVLFDAAALSVGDYSANINIHNSDSENSLIVIPVTLNVDGTDADDLIPGMPQLSQNYPNPFNPVTNIQFTTTDEQVLTSIHIFNMKGQKVKTLVNEILPAGQHNSVWNGVDDENKSVGSGIYFYTFKSGEFSDTRKMILMK